jgi:hypothetical protein
MAGYGGVLKICILMGICLACAAGVDARADDARKERFEDLAGAKAMMIDGYDKESVAPEKAPFYSCDMGLLFVAKVADKADPTVPMLKKKIIDTCAIMLGAYRNKGSLKQGDIVGSADYFTRMDWVKAYHEDVLKLVEEYKNATSFWSYVVPSVNHYDPAKNAFPVGFGGACAAYPELRGSNGSNTFMVLCWETGQINAQMPQDDARKFEQYLASPHFYLYGRVYWTPVFVKEAAGINPWRIKARLVGAEVFNAGPSNGGFQPPTRGSRALALGNVPQ